MLFRSKTKQLTPASAVYAHRYHNGTRGDLLSSAKPALEVGGVQVDKRIELKLLSKGSSVAVELNGFSVFCSQDSIANARASLKDKQSRIVVVKVR